MGCGLALRSEGYENSAVSLALEVLHLTSLCLGLQESVQPDIGGLLAVGMRSLLSSVSRVRRCFNCLLQNDYRPIHVSGTAGLRYKYIHSLSIS